MCLWYGNVSEDKVLAKWVVYTETQNMKGCLWAEGLIPATLCLVIGFIYNGLHLFSQKHLPVMYDLTSLYMHCIKILGIHREEKYESLGWHQSQTITKSQGTWDEYFAELGHESKFPKWCHTPKNNFWLIFKTFLSLETVTLVLGLFSSPLWF